MPFEPGNRYGRQGAVVTDTLRRAAMAGDGKLLRQAVDKCLRQAAAGSLAHLAWIADRLDGRVIPQLPDQGDGTLVVSWVMQGAAPTTIESARQAPDVIEHTPQPTGPIAAVQHETPAHAEARADGGVGGGGVTPTHTVVTPVPSDSGGA